VLQNDVVLRELGRGDVVGELGLLCDAPRSASVRAVRDSTLVRLTKTQFAKIADSGVLAALVRVLATRLHQNPPPAVPRTPAPEVVAAIVGVDADAPVAMVAAELVTALSGRLQVVNPGRVHRDGLDRAERVADKVVLHAPVDDADWRDFCLRSADRVVLVAADPAPPVAPLLARAAGADLVLAGAPASREHRRVWEELITPRSVHAVRSAHAAVDLHPLAARMAGRSVGLVLSGGAARAFAHLGVLEELEAAGVTVDRYAGTSMGAIIAALAATGMDAAAVDANIYEYFIRSNPTGDYTLPSKGLIRGRRTLAALHSVLGERLVEELPKEFRCVSVDLLARRTVVHRRGRLVDVVGCSLRVPGLYAPVVYDGTVHVDGGVLDNLPVAALAREEGPLIAVNIGTGNQARPASATEPARSPRVPNVVDTLLRTMTIGSAMASSEVLAQADLAIHPDTTSIGFLEWHQIDAAREAGRMTTREALPRIMEVVASGGACG
jgi:predicted acylesterase/phospholipase RssA